MWSIAPVGKRTSRIIDVPINGKPNTYTVTRPRVWRCADCVRERREFVAAMTSQYGAHRGDLRPSSMAVWTSAARESFAAMTGRPRNVTSDRMHFAAPLPRSEATERGRVARGRDQMRHITHEAIAWIGAQREAGASLSRIAAAVGVSRSEVSRICREQAQQRAQQTAPRPRRSLIP